MSKIDEAKKLLKRAIEINDAELISIANKLLEEEPPSPHERVESFLATRVASRNDDSFLSPITNKDKPSNKTVPVNEMGKRVNQFHDDGSDAKDINTPDFEPTARQREPFQKVELKCQQCGQMRSINPTHRREHYVCDKCIRSKMR